MRENPLISSFALHKLPIHLYRIKPIKIPSSLSYVKVDRTTGKIDKSQNAKNTYFELFLDENIED